MQQITFILFGWNLHIRCNKSHSPSSDELYIFDATNCIHPLSMNFTGIDEKISFILFEWTLQQNSFILIGRTLHNRWKELHSCYIWAIAYAYQCWGAGIILIPSGSGFHTNKLQKIKILAFGIIIIILNYTPRSGY